MPNQPSSSSPAADKVASIDDLLTEILFRLPVRSLLRFKSVSKHWYSLISSPSFKLLRNPKPDPPSGLFVPVETKTPYLECEFVPLDIENPVNPPFRTLTFDPNGLILCSTQTKEINNNHLYTNKYYVYNPTMDQFTTLPTLANYDISKPLGMTIAFDPSKSPHYRIVYVSCLGVIDLFSATSYQVEIYSSETSTCKTSHYFSLEDDIDMYFGAGTYWNSAIHWLHHTGFLLYYNLDEEDVDHVLTPFGLLGEDDETYTHDIYESRDHLLLVEIINPVNSKFKIYELDRDYSGWSVKYKVDLEVVGRSFPEIFNEYYDGAFNFDLLSVVLGEKEDDSFLVLGLPKKALRFNLVSKTSQKLHDFTGSPIFVRSIDFDGEYVYKPNIFEFIESLYSV